MSDFGILDGKGRGILAEVDNSHRLRTHATSIPIASHVSQSDGLFFMIFSSQATGIDSHTITATGGYLMLIRNVHPTMNMVVVDDVRQTTANNMFMEVVIDVTVGTLGNSEELEPVNVNVGSTNLAATYMEVHVWDEVGDGMTGITGGQGFGPVRQFADQTWVYPVKGAGIVPPGKNIGYIAKGAGEFTLGLTVYMIDPENVG